MHSDASAASLQNRSRGQSQDLAKGAGGMNMSHFKLPSIFFLDLDSLPEKKWKRPGAKASDFFNYGELKLKRTSHIGLTESTWKLYAQFITENEDTFKQICEKEILGGSALTGERRLIPHPNAELNFNLPMDMGGLGPIFNKERYSRVSNRRYAIGELLGQGGHPYAQDEAELQRLLHDRGTHCQALRPQQPEPTDTGAAAGGGTGAADSELQPLPNGAHDAADVHSARHAHGSSAARPSPHADS